MLVGSGALVDSRACARPANRRVADANSAAASFTRQITNCHPYSIGVLAARSDSGLGPCPSELFPCYDGAPEMAVYTYATRRSPLALAQSRAFAARVCAAREGTSTRELQVVTS